MHPIQLLYFIGHFEAIVAESSWFGFLWTRHYCLLTCLLHRNNLSTIYWCGCSFPNLRHCLGLAFSHKQRIFGEQLLSSYSVILKEDLENPFLCSLIGWTLFRPPPDQLDLLLQPWSMHATGSKRLQLHVENLIKVTIWQKKAGYSNATMRVWWRIGVSTAWQLASYSFVVTEVSACTVD